jgi:hypothetical protein
MTESKGTYTVDSVPVSGLAERYNIKPTALYDRLKALGIKPEKRGRSSFISGGQLDEMDQLDLRLKAGEPMPTNMTAEHDEHDRRTFTEHSPNLSAEHSPNSIAPLSPSTDSGLMVIASMLQASLREPRDPMQNYRDLKEAAIEGYLLPTALVQKLIGVTPRGEEFDRLGFRFVRSQRRTEWSVTIAPPTKHPELPA